MNSLKTEILAYLYYLWNLTSKKKKRNTNAPAGSEVTLKWWNNVIGQEFKKCNMNVFADITAQKMKFSIKDFCSKCDHIGRTLQIWLNLLKKSLMENFIFCASVCSKSGIAEIEKAISFSSVQWFVNKRPAIRLCTIVHFLFALFYRFCFVTMLSGCCTISICTFAVLHSFHVALFYVTLFACCIIFMFFVLHFSHTALSSCTF